jgi:hypothetical protein
MNGIKAIIDNVLHTDFINFAFSDISVHREDLKCSRTKNFQDEITNCFNQLQSESKQGESSIKMFKFLILNILIIIP